MVASICLLLLYFISSCFTILNENWGWRWRNENRKYFFQTWVLFLQLSTLPIWAWERSPICIKFPLKIAPRELYTVRKECSQNFLNCLFHRSPFWWKIVFLELIFKHFSINITPFNCGNLIRHWFVRCHKGNVFENLSYTFFNGAFLDFFEIFNKDSIISQLKMKITENFKLL